MHFHFNFSAAEVLWTLQFAALLVLLVVILGRDRLRRFPFFTASMVVVALGMLASRILYHRLPMVVSEEIFLGMADLSALLYLLVVVEIARRAFKGAGRTAWIVGSAVLLVVAALVLIFWGPWPSLRTLFAASELSVLRLMQLFAQKAGLFVDALTVQLGLLVVLFGRHFKAGWRSHTQRLAIGLSTVSLSQLLVRGAQQLIATHTNIHTQEDYKRVIGVIDKLHNADQVIFIVVVVWWIACLWIDEPGNAASSQERVASSEEPVGNS
jgi:hypothetical protein